MDTFELPAESLAAIRQLFFEECEEHLAALEEGLQALLRGTAAPDTLTTAIRAAHSIRGGAAIFDLKPISHLAHLFELGLEAAKSDPALLSPDTLTRWLAAAGGLVSIVHSARAGDEIDEVMMRTASEAVTAPAERRGATGG